MPEAFALCTIGCAAQCAPPPCVVSWVVASRSASKLVCVDGVYVNKHVSCCSRAASFGPTQGDSWDTESMSFFIDTATTWTQKFVYTQGSANVCGHSSFAEHYVEKRQIAACKSCDSGAIYASTCIACKAKLNIAESED